MSSAAEAMSSRERLGRRVPGSGRVQMGARSSVRFWRVRLRFRPRSRALVISSYSVPRSCAITIRMLYDARVHNTIKSGAGAKSRGGVRVERLGKRFGDLWALRDVDLDAP